MKARIALIVVLAAVIILQISYLVKRISSRDYTRPAMPANGGIGPGAAPVAQAPGGMPPPQQMPGGPASGMPQPMPSGRPGMMPSGQPGMMPNGQPAMMPSGQPGMMPSGQPGMMPGGQGGTMPGGKPAMMPSGMPAPGAQGGASQPPVAGGVSVTIDLLPYNEIVSGLLQMQSDSSVAPNAEQKAKMKPLVARLGEVMSKPGISVQEISTIALQTLRADQLEYIAKHRAEPPPLDGVASGPGPIGPDAIGKSSVALLEKRAGEADAAAAPAASPTGDINQTMLGPEDILSGVLKLEADKKLAVTPQQAKVLAAPIKGMVTANSQVIDITREIVKVLNDDQKKFLVKVHEAYMSEVGKGQSQPPANDLAELQRQL